jgi:hypothetical protein
VLPGLFMDLVGEVVIVFEELISLAPLKATYDEALPSERNNGFSRDGVR